MKHLKTKNLGFTLIELLVVISIISVLSSVMLASVAVAKQRAQDTALGSNLRQLQIALQLYMNSNNGNHLLNGGLNSYGLDIYCNGYESSGVCEINKFPDLLRIPLVPNYIPTIDFITKDLGTQSWHQVYYVFDILTQTGSPTYDCGGQILTKYVIWYPIVNASERELKLPFPKNLGGPGWKYCFGA